MHQLHQQSLNYFRLSMSTQHTASLGKLRDAKGLLETLWDESCRPSLRWLRTQQKRRAIPSCRIGRLVFFDPDAVRAVLNGRGPK